MVEKQKEEWNAAKEFSRLNVVRTNEIRPPRLVLFGGPGVGKTSFAAAAEKPIFICTEDGLGQLTVDHFPLASTYDEVFDHVDALVTEDHDYKTVVLDSLDWLEGMVWAKVAEDHGKKNIEDIGFAKGYIYALNYWREILNGLNYLRNTKGMTPILIAHSQIKAFQSPTTEPYDRYMLKLHPKASAIVEEWSDLVGYAGYKVVTKGDKGKGDHVRGIGSGERLLYTAERPGYVAKNRYDLPPEMPLVFDHLMDAIKGQ